MIEPDPGGAPFVLPLDSPRNRIPLSGGKGAALSRMALAGLPVPPGFVLTTEARRASGASGGLPPEVEAAVREALDSLGADSVAVRSSSTAEDGESGSFAGQHDTFLALRRPAEVMAAIERCWRGLHGSRAEAYRKHHGIDATDAEMAVVIQEMVRADASGILFTSDPTAPDGTVSLIEATWGLGEPVVGGRVTPDSIAVDTETGRILKQIVGDKQMMTVAGDDGTREIPVPPERRRSTALDAPAIEELTRLGRQVESLFGGPQDVEWAMAAGRIHLLQARPITAGRAPGDDDWPVIGARPSRPFDLWTRVNVGEVWPDPVSPLSACGIPEMLNGIVAHALPGLPLAREIQWARRWYGRIYYNEGALVHLFHGRLGLPIFLLHDAFGSREALHPDGGAGLRIGRALRSARHILRSAWIERRNEKRLPGLSRLIDRRIEEFDGLDLRAASDRELRRFLATWFDRGTTYLNAYAQMSSTSMIWFGFLRVILARWCGGDPSAHDLLGGLEGIESAEIGPSLHRMASRLRAIGVESLDEDSGTALKRLEGMPAARPVLDDLHRFLVRFGHRCAGEGELMNPRWSERPELVVELIAAYLKGGADPVETLRAQKQRREQATDAARGRFGIARRAIFDAVLRKSQELARLRENGRNHLSKCGFPPVRIYRELARRWSERGWLAEPGDLSFLTFPEIESIIDAGDPQSAGITIPDCVESRRRAYRHWFTIEPPVALDSSGRPVRLPARSPGSRSLDGLPICGGRARGTARVITDPADAVRLTKGEILITRATDAGWTPIFPLIDGMVLEIGGQLSHAAIVAREYGIPAVANVARATTLIRDGEMIVVDGWTGRISLTED